MCMCVLLDMHSSTAAACRCNSWSQPQLARQKASEIEVLLQRLSDANHDMGGVIGGAGDARSHTLARHRDILQDLVQVCTSRSCREMQRCVGCLLLLHSITAT